MSPVIGGTVIISDGEYPTLFLVDTGAEQTVLGSDFAEALEPYKMTMADAYLISPAGKVDSYSARVRLAFVDTTGRKIGFGLTCSVLTDPTQANTHLLGRDILDEFTVICDRRGNVVTLLYPPHTYQIVG
ncbi:MAG: hypothetical protein HY260_20990 [Chloroflexi bacterium]|nr:hypothetical protein [Chloroflexota bacterium]